MINPIGIVYLILFFVGAFYLDRQTKKKKCGLDEKVKENPELYEKMEIEKSKVSSDMKRDLEMTKTGIVWLVVVLILAVVVTFILIYAINNYNVDSETVSFISSLTFVIVIAVFFLVRKNNKNKLTEIVFKLLENKYGMIEKLKTSSPIIVEGKKSEVGNIRHKYSFSYKISKHNCVLSNYYIEELCRHTRYRHSRERWNTTYSYEKRENIMEYCYDLGVINIDSNILIHPNIKQAIEILSETKIIKVSVKNKCLIVEKETILNNYNTEDAQRDTADVELLYKKLVKVILEEAKQ